MITLKEVFTEWKDKIDEPIMALETGCSFMWGEQFDPYISTPNIVEHLVRPTGGKLFSLDNDKDNIDICKKELAKRNLLKYVDFIYGDSVHSLMNKFQTTINFAWLDSSEDAEHALNEYIWCSRFLATKHVVCVDDYGSENSVKWQESSKNIMETFDAYKIYNTPTGLIVGHKVRRSSI